MGNVNDSVTNNVKVMQFEEILRTMGSMKDDYLTYRSKSENDYRLAYEVGTNIMMAFQMFYKKDTRVTGMNALVDGIPLYWVPNADSNYYNICPEDTIFELNERNPNSYRRVIWG